ncbi:ArgP/LysG family DNA-binding transcriptional regulator [Massilia sp. TS11]|uniref:ArgP/LysG family DNA-binding transcriptional regulator n=1 Tax=Massilia sp. TS11 TaxID=2908003 RepID=UPI001EDB9CA5|nr:ArgP/LysG family DNA-binding transcriptional regulator [Massilia sp. TS11]MCG2585092.1 ArgP/LysG family DNA-binding transcriptional regulator [Massilia sp. TS11]
MANLDYKALSVLDAVVETGSFDKAALHLGISQSAVSQRIKALEDACGRLLIVRGLPSVPTGLGQRLVTHFRHVKLMEQALDIDLGRPAVYPAVAVAVDADSLSTWFGQALPPLLSPPRARLDLQLADTAQALALVREGAVFAAVAASDTPAQGTSVLPLGVLRYLCVATPAFAGHWFGDGMQAEAIRLAPGVDGPQGLLAQFLAREYGLRADLPLHVLPLPESLDGAIARGSAYGLVAEMVAFPAIEAGQLVDLTPGRWVDVALSWHAWNIDTPFTRSLSEQVLDTAARYLRPIT